MLMKTGLCIDGLGSVPRVLFLCHCFSFWHMPSVPMLNTLTAPGLFLHGWQPCLREVLPLHTQLSASCTLEDDQNGSAHRPLFPDSTVPHDSRSSSLSYTPQPTQPRLRLRLRR
jgi:hypothetical protein